MQKIQISMINLKSNLMINKFINCLIIKIYWINYYIKVSLNGRQSLNSEISLFCTPKD